MQEERISFETAKLAKEKRFREECSSAYVFRNEYHELPTYKGTLIHNNILLCDIKAPTQSLLQKWLREKYKLHITIYSKSQESWMFRITKPGQLLEEGIYGEDYETYEEALEEGLLKALKLI